MNDPDAPPPASQKRGLAGFDAASARLLVGFAGRLAFFVGVSALAALLDPHPMTRLLGSLRSIFAISALLSVLLGLTFRQQIRAPELTLFDEAAAFTGLGALADALIRFTFR